MKLLSITAQKTDSTGSGVYLTELVRGFEKMGTEQAVIAGISREERMDLPEKVQTFPVYFETEEVPFPVVGMSDEMPYPSTRYSEMTEKMTMQFETAFSARIKEALRTFEPDVILCHHLYFLTALVCRICKEQGTYIPVYGISHGSDLRQIRKNPWQRAYIKRWIPKLDGVFALHEEQKKEICEVYGCGQERIQVIGTGYNKDIFYIEEMKQNFRKKEMRLIFAGKISEKKGVKSLIRAMEYLQGNIKSGEKRPVRLILAGGAGNEQEYGEIRELAEKSSCRIEFAGKLSQKELARKMNQSDIFVLPSFFEGLPLVVVEAMACGLRVVCTDLPGIRPWLNKNIPGNGVVFVKPPQMQNEDEPVEEKLPAFEKELAEAVEMAAAAKLPDSKVLENISWEGLCRRMAAVWEKESEEHGWQ